MIILMVLGHVVGADATQGLRVDEGSSYNYLFHVFEYMRMPLFTVMSGYVYALKPISKNYSVKEFIQRKVYRLLVPFIIASTLFFVVQSLTPGTNAKVQIADILHIYFYSYGHFWFVQGIFFVFILLAVLDYIGCLDTISNWAIVFGLTGIIYIVDSLGSPFLSTDRWPFLMLFVLWGLAIKRFSVVGKTYFKQVLNFMILLFFIGFSMQHFLFFNGFVSRFKPMVAHIIVLSVALSSSFLLMHVNLVNNFLIKLGNYSYEIYLYHVFGTAGARFLLQRLGVDNMFWHVFAGLSFGILLPLLLKNRIKQFPVMNLLLFGERPRRIPVTRVTKNSL